MNIKKMLLVIISLIFVNGQIHGETIYFNKIAADERIPYRNSLNFNDYPKTINNANNSINFFVLVLDQICKLNMVTRDFGESSK